MSRPKIGIIGAGNVGANTALFLFLKDLGDIVLYDLKGDLAKGKALDIMHLASIWGTNSFVTGTGNIDDIAGSDLVVITAGKRRTADMTRDDLLSQNGEIITKIVDNIQQKSPNSFIVVVTNPLDAMAHLALEISNFEPSRVMGMSGVLDAGRLAHFIREKHRVASENILTTVLGGHGDSMVPVSSNSFIGGRPLKHILDPGEIEEVIERTRKAGGEIIQLMGTSSMYAPAAAVWKMAQAILHDEKTILPCSVYLQGEYKLSDVFLSVPVLLGKTGVEEIIELPLEKKELKALHKSADEVKELTRKLNIN